MMEVVYGAKVKVSSSSFRGMCSSVERLLGSLPAFLSSTALRLEQRDRVSRPDWALAQYFIAEVSPSAPNVILSTNERNVIDRQAIGLEESIDSNVVLRMRQPFASKNRTQVDILNYGCFYDMLVKHISIQCSEAVSIS